MKAGSRRAAVPADYPARIRRLRADLGLTQTAMAELLGVHFTSVNRWENGQSKPGALAWQRIARAAEHGLEALTGEVFGGASLARESGSDLALAPAEGAPDLDFAADPEVVRTVAEGERLSYGHLFNPAFATEVSRIDPLPHQRVAVYERMLGQSRLRFLLADDAGAGKTIMTGLYIREMLSRRLLRRIVIVPPAGLIGNWQRELRRLFALPFRIVTGADAKSGNPFTGPDSDRLIVSLDTLAGEMVFARLQSDGVEPYDLVVFDEAHKLSADREPDFRLRKTDRYRLAEALAGVRDGESDPRWHLDWRCRHLLLLTATPHMGKDFPFYCLWRLLEPEALPTIDAFHAWPAEARQRYYIRRTKEEMVDLDGRPLYPTRVSDTMSYDLSQGEVSEQRLYDETTEYIRTYYNRARVLNRSAAQLAMSVFQRRLASSTYALLRSFERRLRDRDSLIAGLRSGKLTPAMLEARQRRLQGVPLVQDELTGDEETAVDGREQSEVAEEELLSALVSSSLADLEVERQRLRKLRDLAQQVCDVGEEAKLEKLREVIRDPRFAGEKLIIFTEYRDTAEFLIKRLEGLGFTGRVAAIHGGMDYQAREAQVELFRQPPDQGGAQFLVATDAAGEGINLQFCWLMVNYDIPWNPARLEQRMGRIHRYGQRHDPVLIANLVAGKTREGRVLRTLLDKLEHIRRELRSDKVFDVIGRLFEGVPLSEYMAQALTEEGAEKANRLLEGRLTPAQVEALRETEERLLASGGEVKEQLPAIQGELRLEQLRRLLPGYVRRFLESALPMADLAAEGDLDQVFSLRATAPGALDPFWPVLEGYPPEARTRFTLHKPAPGEQAVFLHPGEPFFERLREVIGAGHGREALRGAVFLDPTATRPYLLHLVRLMMVRRSDQAHPSLEREELLEQKLVALRQDERGEVVKCPLEHWLLLKGGRGFTADGLRLVAVTKEFRQLARAFAIEQVARGSAERRRRDLAATVAERRSFVAQGFDHQAAELAAVRVKLAEKAAAGDPSAKGELTRVKARQAALAERKAEALAAVSREPELVVPGEVVFLAHALVLPSTDPEDRKRHDEGVEAMAVRLALEYERERGAEVKDVSHPELARLAGLGDWPGFDLHSVHPTGAERAIEVKGRAGVGSVELSENEWAKAGVLRDQYWLYVVFECATAHPRLWRVQDPFRKLIMQPKGGVIISEQEIFNAAEGGIS
jgi:superfamily II DNA or RNA helicase/DNA-binding XRE family transcriptional regulator